MQSSSLNPHVGKVMWKTEDPMQVEKEIRRERQTVAQGAGQKQIDSSISGRLNEFSKGNRFLVYEYSLVCVRVCFLFSKASFSRIIQFSSSLKPSLPSQKFSFFS